METYIKWNANQKYEAGVKQLNKYRYGVANNFFSEAIGLFSENPVYYHHRGIARFNLLNYNAAFQDAGQALLLDEKFKGGHILMMQCCLALGDISGATNAIETMIELCPAATNDFVAEQVKLSSLRDLLNQYNSGFDAKNFSFCLSLMEKVVELSPGSFKFQLNRAECMMQMKRFQEATNIVQKIIQIDNLNAEAHYVLGLINYHRDVPEKAIKCLESSLQNDQEFRKAKELRVLIKEIQLRKEQAIKHFQKNEFDEALAVYKNVLNFDLKDNDEVKSKMHFNCALMNSKLHKFDEAINDCTKALELNPQYYKAIWKRAQCQFQRERYDECVRDCIQAYTLDGTMEVMNLYNEAFKILHQSNCVLQNTSSTQQLIESGNSLFDKGSFAEAADMCSLAISMCPTEVNLYEYRIECHFNAGDYKAALSDLELLSLLDSCSFSRKLMKVKCLILIGDLEKAKHLMNELSKASSDEEELRKLENILNQAFTISQCYKDRNYDLTLCLLEEFTKKYCKKLLTINHLLIMADCLAHLNRHDEALSILKDILERDRYNTHALYLLGLVHYQSLQFDVSIKRLEECLDCDLSNEEAQLLLKKVSDVRNNYHLGVKLYGNGYYDEAISPFEYIQKLLDSDNQNALADVLAKKAQTYFRLGQFKECINNCLQFRKYGTSDSNKNMLAEARTKWINPNVNVDNTSSIISESIQLKIKSGLKYLQVQDFKSARQFFTEAIDANTGKAELYVHRGECNLRLKDYPAALADGQQATNLNKDCIEGYLLTAECHIHLGDLFETDNVIQKIRNLNPDDAKLKKIELDFGRLKVVVTEIIKEFNCESYQICIDNLDIALEIAEASVHFQIIKAECHAWLGEFNEVLHILSTNAQANDSKYIKGLVCYLKNNFEKSLLYLSRCIEADNNHTSAKRILSNLRMIQVRRLKGKKLMETEQFEDAINTFTEALLVDKKNAVVNCELHFQCAICNAKLGYRKECINSCNAVINLTPTHTEAIKLRDKCQQEIDDLERERILADKAAMHNQNGDMLKNRGDYQNAIASYGKAISLKPTVAAYYANRAACYLMLGDFAATLTDARQSSVLDPTFIDGFIWEAKCLILLGDTESKIEVLDKLEELEESNTIKIEQKKEIFELQKIQKLFIDATASFTSNDYEKCIQHIDEAFLNIVHSTHYKLMRIECLIRLYRLQEAVVKINESDVQNNPRCMYLVGLWHYYNDAFDKAVEHFSAYKTYQKSTEMKKFLGISHKILDLYKQSSSFWNKFSNTLDSDKKMLKLLKIEIKNYNHQNKVNYSENRKKLNYQMACVNYRLGKKQEALENCADALYIEPRYVNVLSLRAQIFNDLQRYEECLRDRETLLRIEENADTRQSYEALKNYLAKSQAKIIEMKEANSFVIVPSPSNFHNTIFETKIDNNINDSDVSGITQMDKDEFNSKSITNV